MSHLPPPPRRFRPLKILRLSTFEIGSAMGDILLTTIWNRILIVNFGIPATPVGIIIALRYLLAPLSLWAGLWSDTRPFLGFRRSGYIWVGRGLMVASLPLLGLSVTTLEGHTASPAGWALAVLSALLYGIGTLLSGSPFLALVRDSAPPERQGLAMGIAETMLIVFFAIMGVVFSFWMPEYDPAVFWQLVIATMSIGGFFWFFAILGVEKRVKSAYTTASADAFTLARLRSTFNEIWADGRTRRFFYYLAVTTLAAWTQETILEPFGAEVLDLPFDLTTRLNSYWQTATVLTLVGGAIAWRKNPPETQTGPTRWGLGLMALGLLLTAVAGFAGGRSLLLLAMVVFGGGFGFYTFGSFSLMVVMASDARAGAYLGLYTIAILIFRGIGTSVGGILRDVLLLAGLPLPVAYGAIFTLEAVGLLLGAALLTGHIVLSFARDAGRVSVPPLDTAVSAD